MTEVCGTYKTWLAQNNIYTHPGTYVSVDDGIRGFKTSNNISKGALVMAIPKACLITEVMAFEYAKSIGIDLHGLDNSAHNALVLYILDAKALPSPGKHGGYLNALPTDVSEFPVTWANGSAEYDLIQGSDFGDAVHRRYLQYLTQYHQMEVAATQPAHHAPWNHTFQQYTWARVMVDSRNFTVTFDDGNVLSMVPHADMLNHDSNSPDTRWSYDQHKQMFTMIACHDIKAGTYVSTSYGCKSPIYLMYDYGFFSEDGNMASCKINITSGEWLGVFTMDLCKSSIMSLMTHSKKTTPPSPSSQSQVTNRLHVIKVFVQLYNLFDMKSKNYVAQWEWFMNEFKTCSADRINYHNACGTMMAEMGVCYVWKEAIKRLLQKQWLFNKNRSSDIRLTKTPKYPSQLHDYIVNLEHSLQKFTRILSNLNNPPRTKLI